MQKIDLGQTITILANIGVIAGIVFLAVELRQNNEQLSAQAKFNLHQNKYSITDQVIESSEFANFITRISTNQPHTPEDELRIYHLTIRHLGNWQWEYLESVEGRLDEEDLPLIGWRADFSGGGALGLPPFDSIWEAGKDAYDPRFVRFMEENVIEP